MRVALVCVGRLKSGPERALFERYFKRLAGSARGVGIAGVDLREIGESRARRPEDRRAEEADAILATVSADGALVALDERGASPSSAEWAADIGRARDASRPTYVVVIGGPDGLADALKRRAHRTIGFGSMTWPHQLVRVMACEQLYRAITILSRHPYHRA
jgi:23S rRNA (pseudouridine1915-N3)-methyltransferase